MRGPESCPPSPLAAVSTLCTLTLVLVGLGLTFTSALYFDEKHFEDYDSADVVVRHNERRYRRSSDVMPTELDVTVTSRGSDVRLRLRRNAAADVNIPVFTLHRGHCIQQSIPDSSHDISRSGFYQDVDSGASLFVRRAEEHLKSFDLEGPLIINGSEFLLTPSRDLLAMNRGSRAHRLKRVMTTLNFGHDFMDERKPLETQQRALRAYHRRLLRQSRRSKRMAIDVHTIELTVVADYKIYDRFLDYAGGKKDKALQELKHYYIFMTNLMDIRYASVTTLDPSLKIDVALVALVVADVRAEAVWTERNRLGRGSLVDAESALYSFRDWLRTNTDIPRADHWMLFTGYDLAESSGVTATIGIAFIGTLCTDSAVSLVEEYFTATSGAVSAHELGHSIDADHDRMYRGCSDEDSHVMSTVATFPLAAEKASNPWRFSPCSVDAFGAYLDTVECAVREPPKSISSKKIGGLHFDADKQCELAMGSDSYFCRTVQSRLGYDVSCRRLYCYLPDEPGYCASIVPQEFTSCNDRKWCRYGKCVPDQKAPRTILNCPQGDDKRYDCRSADCSNKKVKNAYCCRTCAQRSGVSISGSGSTPRPVPTTAEITRQATAAQRTTSLTTTSATTMTTTTTESTTTESCQGFACQCQRRWSVFCYFLYRG